MTNENIQLLEPLHTGDKEAEGQLVKVAFSKFNFLMVIKTTFSG